MTQAAERKELLYVKIRGLSPIPGRTFFDFGKAPVRASGHEGQAQAKRIDWTHGKRAIIASINSKNRSVGRWLNQWTRSDEWGFTPHAEGYRTDQEIRIRKTAEWQEELNC